MSNTVKDVWRFLDDNPCIRKTMQCDLLNIRALAKHIIREKKIQASLDAVIGAIRRYEPGRYENVFHQAHDVILKTVNISARNKITVVSLSKDSDVQQKLPQLFGIINYVKGDILRITQANESIKVMVDTKNQEKVTKLFPKEKVISIERDLVEIDMTLDPRMQETQGILSVITTELAINGVNIVEAITCPPELLWFVREDDLLKALNILYGLCQLKTKSTPI